MNAARGGVGMPAATQAGAVVARALGDATMEALHVMSSPLNSLQLANEVQRTLLERGRHDEARGQCGRVQEEIDRVIDLVRLLRDFAGACASLPDVRGARALAQPMQLVADAQTRMFVDPRGDAWFGSRDDGAFAFTVLVIAELAFEEGAQRVELRVTPAADAIDLSLRAALPESASVAAHRHAALRVRRALIDGMVAAADMTLSESREGDWRVWRLRGDASRQADTGGRQ